MGKFSKYLGETQEVTIEYENGTNEIVHLKPLNWEDVDDLMLIGKDLGDKPEEVMKRISSETIEKMKKVVMKTLKISYPEEPEEELKAFASKNFMILFPLIFDLNFNVGKSDKLEKIKARMNVRKISSNKTKE